MTGTATFTQASGSGPPAPPALSPGAKIVVEGFDLATGRTAWSFDAGADAALVEETAPPQVGPETAILSGAGGAPTEVDLMTGEQKAVPVGTVAWCSAPTTYNMSVPYQAGNGRTISDYTGDFATVACDANGHPAPSPATVPPYVPSWAASSRAANQAGWSPLPSQGDRVDGSERQGGRSSRHRR
jgi:hypothetical protein